MTGQKKIVAKIDPFSRPPGQSKESTRRHQGQAGKMQGVYRGLWGFDRCAGPQQCICADGASNCNAKQKSDPKKKPGGIEPVVGAPRSGQILHRVATFLCVFR
jgi:hypothetical protein